MSAAPVSRTESAITKRGRRRTAQVETTDQRGNMAEERIEAIADADQQQPSAWQRTL